MRRPSGALVGALLGFVGLAGSAAAETGELRVLRPFDLTVLPLLVAEHEKLIEKHAEMIGVGPVAVIWSPPGKAGALAALLSGDADIAALDLAPFIAAWDERAGTAQAMGGFAATEQMPYVLVTRNPAIRTIRDFGDKDRIAVAGLKTSGPAVMLEMAAAQEWGPGHYDRLDPLTVARPDAEAAASLVAGSSEFDAHVTRTPYADDELAEPAIHRVMDSFDIAGPHSAGVLAATVAFHDANPKIATAVMEALEEAADMVRKNPGDAAEIYAGMSKDRDVSVEDITDMIGDPDYAYTTAPTGVMQMADFLYKLGRLNRRPAGWRDLFFLEAHDLPGN